MYPEVDGRRVPWNEALNAAAERLRAVSDRYGRNAVGIYVGNPMAFNTLGAVGILGFARALGTRNVYTAGSQDCANKFAAGDMIHGSPLVHPVPDFERTDLAVVIGSNPFVSQSSFVHLEGGAPVFQGIVERGGHVVWVDPRRTESAKRCGEHLAIVPGTDVWLLMALLHELADDSPRHDRIEGLDEILAAARAVSVEGAGRRTGLGEVAIRALADRIRASTSTAFHMSVGVAFGGFGTLGYVVLQALIWVTGNFDREGGSLFHPAEHWLGRALRAARVNSGSVSRIGGFGSTAAALPGGVLADEISTPGDGQIRAMVVVAGDPIRSIPGSDQLREAFDSLEHVVAIDMFRNETGQRADVFLSAASWLERWDVAATTVPFQAGNLVQMAGSVMKPRGESRTDLRILSDLAIAMGHCGVMWRLGRLNIDRFLPSPKFGLRTRRLRPGRYLRRHRIWFWTGQIAADVERMQSAAPPDNEGFRLMTRRRRLGHISWIQGARRDGDSEPVAWMRAEDMAEIGVEDGGEIEIRSATGSLSLLVKVQEGLAPRTVVVPHGVPDVNVNRVIPSGVEAIERISGQHVMTGIAAHVSPRVRGDTATPGASRKEQEPRPCWTSTWTPTAAQSSRRSIR